MVFSLRSWGYGQYGAHALGVTDDVDVDAPGQIELGSLSGRAPRCIAAGPVHGVLVTEGNDVYVWGHGGAGQLGLKEAKTQTKPVLLPNGPWGSDQIAGVAVGGRHSLIWTDKGEIYGMGSNFDAQLGYDFALPEYRKNWHLPHRMPYWDHQTVSGTDERMKATAAACTARGSLVVLNRGRGGVWSVGYNGNGQLGIGSSDDLTTPKAVQGLPDDVEIEAISAGDNHVLALTNDGRVYAWGHARALGTRTNHFSAILVPYLGSETAKIVKVACGAEHSVALSSDGVVYTFGSNTSFQLGFSEDDDATATGRQPQLEQNDSIGLLPRQMSRSASSLHSKQQAEKQNTEIDLNPHVESTTPIAYDGGKRGTLPTPSVVHSCGQWRVVGIGAGERWTALWTADGRFYFIGQPSNLLFHPNWTDPADESPSLLPVLVKALREQNLDVRGCVTGPWHCIVTVEHNAGPATKEKKTDLSASGPQPFVNRLGKVKVSRGRDGIIIDRVQR